MPPTLQEREQHEREVFSRVGAEGRSSVTSDAELVMPEATFTRYRDRLTGAVAPVTPLEQMFAFLGPSLAGKKVLEICGHDGEFGTILARLGADVTSVDIAEPLIDLSKRRAQLNGVADKLKPMVMSVHNMTFADGTFDVVFGKAALHHLDLTYSRNECHRVLKKGGVAVFSEPVAFSATLAALRERVPVKPDRESPDERPLTGADLEEFCRPFSDKKLAYYRIFSRLDRVVPRFAMALCKLDRKIVEMLPASRMVAGQCAFALTK